MMYIWNSAKQNWVCMWTSPDWNGKVL